MAFREILIHQELSRVEIARSLGLSRTSLTRAVRELVEHEMVEEIGSNLRGTAGRPSELLRARSGVWEFMGVKLTAERLYVAVTSIDGRVIAVHEEPLTDTDPEAVANQIARAAESLKGVHPSICAIGVSLPGDVVVRHGEAVVAESSFLHWRDVPFASMLTAKCGLTVFTANDVHALTAKEHWFGAGAGRRSMALVTVGQGIGFGLIANGQVSSGEHGRLGKLGHLPTSMDGPECDAGHRGCAASFLINDAIIRNAGRDGMSYGDVVELARNGDVPALNAFGDAGRALGVLLASILNLLDPAAIVLTGDGLPVYDIARDEVDRSLHRGLMPSSQLVTVEVQPFEFTDWARASAVVAVRGVLGQL